MEGSIFEDEDLWTVLWSAFWYVILKFVFCLSISDNRRRIFRFRLDWLNTLIFKLFLDPELQLGFRFDEGLSYLAACEMMLSFNLMLDSIITTAAELDLASKYLTLWRESTQHRDLLIQKEFMRVGCLGLAVADSGELVLALWNIIIAFSGVSKFNCNYWIRSGLAAWKCCFSLGACRWFLGPRLPGTRAPPPQRTIIKMNECLGGLYNNYLVGLQVGLGAIINRL